MDLCGCFRWYYSMESWCSSYFVATHDQNVDPRHSQINLRPYFPRVYHNNNFKSNQIILISDCAQLKFFSGQSNTFWFIVPTTLDEQIPSLSYHFLDPFLSIDFTHSGVFQQQQQQEQQHVHDDESSNGIQIWKSQRSPVYP